MEDRREEGRREGKNLNQEMLNQLKEMVSRVCYNLAASDAVCGKESLRIYTY